MLHLTGEVGAGRVKRIVDNCTLVETIANCSGGVCSALFLLQIPRRGSGERKVAVFTTKLLPLIKVASIALNAHGCQFYCFHVSVAILKRIQLFLVKARTTQKRHQQSNRPDNACTPFDWDYFEKIIQIVTFFQPFHNKDCPPRITSSHNDHHHRLENLYVSSGPATEPRASTA